jgi:cytochrome c556
VSDWNNPLTQVFRGFGHILFAVCVHPYRAAVSISKWRENAITVSHGTSPRPRGNIEGMTMSLKKLTALSVAGLLAVALAAPVFAEGETLTGTDAIAKRQELMKTNGATLKAAQAATGDARVTAAQQLVDDFAQIGELFPEDSQTGGNTRALPAIWTDQEGFMMAYTAAVTASANLLAVAPSGDDAAWTKAIQDMGASCGGCHTKYRAP